MEVTAEWGQRIRERREELGLSVDELAERIERHLATVYRYESGETTPPPSIQVLIATALESDPHDLFPLVAS
jgi:transcriptional regulator with XRE-family HTH domain